MKYQRKLHDAFGEKVVPARVRRAALEVVGEADAEVERLRSSLVELADVLGNVLARRVTLDLDPFTEKQIRATLAKIGR